jgi:hypothetical protein
MSSRAFDRSGKARLLAFLKVRSNILLALDPSSEGRFFIVLRDETVAIFLAVATELKRFGPTALLVSVEATVATVRIMNDALILGGRFRSAQVVPRRK